MWTEEKNALLRRLWDEGLPCRTIGLMVGATKNSVIGKAGRLGLARRVERHWRATQKKHFDKLGTLPRSRIKPPPVRHEVKKVVAIVDATIPAEQRKTLFEIGPNDCRFPVGDPTKGFWCNEEFFFCGGPTDGGTYCAGHEARVRYTRPANPPKHEQPIRERQARPVQEPAIQGLVG